MGKLKKFMKKAGKTAAVLGTAYAASKMMAMRLQPQQWQKQIE